MARLFNGTSMRMYTNGAAVTAVPLSIFAWVYPTSLSGRREIFSINAETGASVNSFGIGIDGNTDTAFAVTGDTADSFANSSTTFSGMNVWHSVLGVFSATNSRTIYLEGGGKVTNTTSRTPSSLTQMTAGCFSRGTDAGSGNFNFFAGRIAWVSVWNVALNDAEAAALARGGHPLSLRPSALVYCAPLLGIVDPEPDWNPSGGTKRELIGINSPTLANGPPLMQPYSQRFWRAGFVVAGGAGTFTATSAVTAGAATASGSATFAPGTKTATGAVTTGAATCSGSATFGIDARTGTGAVSTGPATCSGSATFAPGTKTASGTPAIGPATCSGVATFGPGTKTASGSPTTGAATCAGTATFSPGTKTAVGGLTSPRVTCAGVGTVVNPTVTASGAVTAPGATLSGTALTVLSTGLVRVRDIRARNPDITATAKAPKIRATGSPG